MSSPATPPGPEGPHATVAISAASVDETVRAGEALGAVVRAGDIVALHGGLGAGKTQFVRGLCAGMGLDPSNVSSPTFVVMTEHDRPLTDLSGREVNAARGTGDTPLIHADAYRLSGADDLDTLGWERAISGDAVIAVEWAERIAAGLPRAGTRDGGRVAHVRIEPTGESTRRIVIGAPVAWTLRTGWLALAGLGERPPRAGGAARCVVCGGRTGGSKGAPAGPFCSERCRLADLNLWLTGGSVVEGREGDVGGRDEE